MVLLAKAADVRRSREEAPKSRVSSFLMPFLYKRLENGHNLAILAPINLY